MVSILGLALALLLNRTAQAAAAAPPPPTFSFEATTVTSGAAASPAVESASPTAAAEPAGDTATADAALFNWSGEGDDKPLAPTISDEALIASSMEVAYQLYHAEDFQGTAQSCQAIIDKYPKKDILTTRYLLALSQEHIRAYKDALAQYQKIIKIAPKSTFANAASFRIGMCHMEMGRSDEAVRTFRDIIDFNPKSEYRLQAFIHLGNFYRSVNNWRQCEVIYKDLLRLYPCSSWSFTAAQYLAEAFAHQGEDDKAIRVYKGMQRDACTPALIKSQAQLRIADLHMNRERYQDALSAYKDAIRNYGELPGITGYCEDKIEQAREGRSMNPDLEARRRQVTVKQAMEE
jgi:TolA-binding protein